MLDMPFQDEKFIEAFYGLLGLGALVALKYIYPGVKKFLVKKFGHTNDSTPALDPVFAQHLAINMREILKLASGL
jgi:hypothetical protein